MNLFSNIYNTVAKFFRAQEEQDEASKSVATNRLKLVLMQDRTNLTPRILEQMRSELIDLLSRYVELDKDLLDLNFEQEGDQVALMLSIPVIRAKDEEEIDAAIKAHNEAMGIKDNKAEEDSEEDDDESENDDEETSEEVSEEEISETENSEITDDAQKAEEIANELQNIPKVIKKKKVSAPEDISNNPFKPENINKTEIIESSSET